jgi:hypothetical protein
MFWMIVTRFFCKTEILRDFPFTLKAGIFKKTKSLLSLKSVFDFFITLEQSKTRQDKFESILEIIESVVFFNICKSSSGFGRIFCTVFETVCASSLAMCAYQISEHLHLTFADHLDLYNQQANPNFRLPSEQIPLFSE